MGAMYRLKAYFGMVPAEELAEYADEPERYAPPARRTVRDFAAEREPELRERETGSRWDDRYVADDDRYDAEESWERRPARTAVAERSVERVPSVVAARSTSAAPVRGALAIDPDSVRLPTLVQRAGAARAARPAPRRSPGSPHCIPPATTRPARSASATATASR